MVWLNEREQVIYDYIIEFARAKGYPPSVREIGTAVGLKSSSTVHKYLSSMEEKGFLRRDPLKPRALEVLKPKIPKKIREARNNEVVSKQDTTTFKQPIVSASDTVSVPLLGRVAAGYPIFAEENVEEYFPLPASIASDGDSYMLQVTGQSMIGAGIFDGDYVIVRRQEVARNGEIVVALLEDEATVKRFFMEKEYMRLEPENPAFAPILTSEAQIIGKVIGLIRKLH